MKKYNPQRVVVVVVVVVMEFITLRKAICEQLFTTLFCLLQYTMQRRKIKLTG
jgi:hypothetical protein